MGTFNARIETGSHTNGLSVRITDDKSGQTIASFQLDSAQVFDLVRGAMFDIEASITNHLDRIGKTMVTERVEVPADVLKGVHYSDRESYGERWAQYNHPGWASYDARRNNMAGVNVVMRKWVEA